LSSKEAIAKIPEFKGTVTAVHKDQFWDAQLAELNHRNSEIIRKVNQAAQNDKRSFASVDQATHFTIWARQNSTAKSQKRSPKLRADY